MAMYESETTMLAAATAISGYDGQGLTTTAPASMRSAALASEGRQPVDSQSPVDSRAPPSAGLICLGRLV